MDIPDILPNALLFIEISTRLHRDLISDMIVRSALRGGVDVLDAGNTFNAYHITRQIRRHTAQVDKIMERIRVARAFTCYQLVTLTEQTLAAGTPIFILDLLAPFTDEQISLRTRERLLGQVLSHLNKLRDQVPVILSARPPTADHPKRCQLFSQLREAAQMIFVEQAVTRPSQKPLL